MNKKKIKSYTLDEKYDIQSIKIQTKKIIVIYFLIKLNYIFKIREVILKILNHYSLFRYSLKFI